MELRSAPINRVHRRMLQEKSQTDPLTLQRVEVRSPFPSERRSDRVASDRLTLLHFESLQGDSFRVLDFGSDRAPAGVGVEQHCRPAPFQLAGHNLPLLIRRQTGVTIARKRGEQEAGMPLEARSVPAATSWLPGTL